MIGIDWWGLGGGRGGMGGTRALGGVREWWGLRRLVHRRNLAVGFLGKYGGLNLF